MNFDSDIESVPKPQPHIPETALSPVGETMGDTLQPKHQVNKEQILSETALETASNY